MLEYSVCVCVLNLFADPNLVSFGIEMHYGALAGKACRLIISCNIHHMCSLLDTGIWIAKRLPILQVRIQQFLKMQKAKLALASDAYFGCFQSSLKNACFLIHAK